MVFGGAGSSNIAIHYGFTGQSNANSNSCSSGAIAIGEAYRYVRDGYADIMVAGSAEAPLYALTFSAFTIIRSMSTNVDPMTACRPFDLHRDGFVMGEASAVLVLEERNSAVRRGSHLTLRSSVTHATTARSLVQPRPDGESAARVMRDALSEARISPDEIGYIMRHASGTVLNDKCETIAIKKSFWIRVEDSRQRHQSECMPMRLARRAQSRLRFVQWCLKGTIFHRQINLSTPDPNATSIVCQTSAGMRALITSFPTHSGLAVLMQLLYSEDTANDYVAQFPF